MPGKTLKPTSSSLFFIPGDFAGALEFIHSKEGKEAYEVHLGAGDLLWTLAQVEAAAALSLKVADEKGRDELGDEYDDVEYFGVVEGKKFEAVVDFHHRCKPKKR